jgi:outer membrane protein OmpA-like peptidoglycan-associated protein/tetratricopeptide (TPR) repeat protein
MNRVIFSIVILTFVFNFQGSSQIRKANKLLELYNYAEAIPLYLNAAESNRENVRNEAVQKLAHCYRMTNNVAKANIWYEKAVELENTDPENYFYLGQSLQSLGRYEEAASAFLHYNQIVPDDDRGKMYYQFCIDIQDWLDLPEMAEIRNVDAVNTKYSDFGPAHYRNGIVFSSDRKSGSFESQTYGWTSFNYLNLFYSEPEYSGSFWGAMGPPEIMENNFNQAYHDGPATFTADNRKVYITRTVARKGKKEDGIRTYLLKIFHANIEPDKKLRPEPFFLNSEEYSVAHPTLNKEGNIIVFSSDMPGGFGGADLYMCKRENGQWGPPVNLGEQVNSMSDEVFPYLANDSLLYFSSDGHLGFGGLDVFKTRLNNEGWTSPENLKKPVNSSYDDFGIVFSNDLQSGFFSSNRPEGKGSDDIYAFRNLKFLDETSPSAPIAGVEPVKLRAVGVVKDKKTDKPLADATVFFYDPATQDVLILKTDENGQYETPVDFDHIYIPRAMKDGYIFDCTSFRTPPEQNNPDVFKVPQDLLLTRLEVDLFFEVENIYYDLDKWFIREDAQPALDDLVQIMKQYPISAELSSHTDSRASHAYNMDLSQKRAEAAVRYIVLQGVNPARITARGYGETRLVNRCADGVDCTEEEHQANRRTEFRVTGISTEITDDQIDLSLFKEGDLVKSYLLPVGFFENCFGGKNVSGTSGVIEKQGNINRVENQFANSHADNTNFRDLSFPKNTETGSVAIQVMALGKKVDIPNTFSDIKDFIDLYGMHEIKENGFYKYQLGNFKTETEAQVVIGQLKERGYNGCFKVEDDN